MARHQTILAAALLSAAALSGLAGPAGAQDAIPDYIAAAVSDPNRPAEDTARDADRKPAESMAFSTMKPGDTVVELLPGGGYFTRIFSKVVGSQGHVYTVVPFENMQRNPDADAAVQAIAADPNYSNVTVIHPPIRAIGVGEPQEITYLSPPITVYPMGEQADVAWTSLNYHDLKNRYDVDAMVAMNESIYDTLKPGGIYYVIDHEAVPGTGFDATDTVHRIDPEALKAEVLAAGFVLDAESDLLDNPDDDHSLGIFDDAIRGHTDQFILRFRKPE